MPGALPTAVVIGAMKCGTTALSRYLALHPDVAVAPAKELNFFFGADHPGARHGDAAGQWHRGPEWYAGHFDRRAPVRAEASPGYTSPDHPRVAARMAATVPDARLVYLVRDPAQRALSHYAHHVRDGAERRPVAQAVLDPASQYVSRSRYFERLLPFLDAFPREQILVVVAERLMTDRRRQLARVFDHVGAAPSWWDEGLHQRVNVGSGADAPPWLSDAVAARVADDTARLAELLGDELPEWRQSTCRSEPG